MENAASHAPSISTCMASRQRRAPSASRTANSCCRSVPRAISRLAMFAHAISSSNAAAACQIARNGPAPASDSPRVKLTTDTSRVACVSGNCWRWRATMAFISARAVSIDCSSASRARTSNQPAPALEPLGLGVGRAAPRPRRHKGRMARAASRPPPRAARRSGGSCGPRGSGRRRTAASRGACDSTTRRSRPGWLLRPGRCGRGAARSSARGRIPGVTRKPASCSG